MELTECDVSAALQTHKGRLKNSSDDSSFTLISEFWSGMESNGVDPTLHPNVGFRAPSDVSAALKAARQSSRLDSVKQQDLQYTGATPKANVTVSTSSTVDPVVNKWLHEWTSKCNGQSGENKRQIEVL